MKTSTTKILSAKHAILLGACTLIASLTGHADPLVMEPEQLTAPANFLSAGDTHSSGLFTAGQGAVLDLKNGVAIGTSSSRAAGIGGLKSLISLGGNNGAYGGDYGALTLSATSAPVTLYGTRTGSDLVGIYFKTSTADTTSKIDLGNTTSRSVIDLLWDSTANAGWFNGILAESRGLLNVNIVNTEITMSYDGGNVDTAAGIYINSSWGSPGATLTTDELTTITTTGNKTHAIKAAFDNSIVINNAATLSTSGTYSWGIYANGAQSGPSSVTNTGAITTLGYESYGIYSNTAKDGAIAITNHGHISTSGTYSHGIYALIRSATAIADITITNTGDIDTTKPGANGIYARNEGHGSVIIEASGNINTASGHGINAVAMGAESDVTVNYTSGTITTSQTNSSGPAGIAAWNDSLATSYGRATTVTTAAGTEIIAGRGIAAHTRGTLADGASTTVNNAATINAVTWGIDARNVSTPSAALNDSPVTVNNTGNITATAASDAAAIRTETQAGTIRVTNAANLSTLGSGTNNHALYAAITNAASTADILIGVDTDGTTAAPITGNLSTAGDASYGIYTTNAGSGNIVINSAADITTTGSNSRGIYAYATGSGDINITQSAGSIATTNGAGVYARTTSGDITIDTTGATLDINDNSNPNHLAGGTGVLGYAGGNGNVSITTGAGTVHLGNNSDDAIIGLALGTGSVTINNAADVIHEGTRGDHFGIVAISGYNSSGTNGSTVTVTNSGDISTAGGDSIYAESRHAGGDVTIINSGDIVISNTSHSGIRGLAGTIASATGSLHINNAGTITTGSTESHGIHGTTAGSGETTIENFGDITTNGNASKGIYAVSSASTAGKISITSSGNITNNGATGMTDGISATTYGPGGISITASGDITLNGGGAAHGILADGQGASASGDLEIDYSNGTLTTTHNQQRALEANNYGTAGDINITNSGTLVTSGENSTGISARITQTTNTTGAITIVHSGDITTEGNTVAGDFNSHGISGTTPGNNINITAEKGSTITTRGNASNGINAVNSGTGDIMINSAATITSENGSGIYASAVHNNGGNITITHDGDITAAQNGIIAVIGNSGSPTTATGDLLVTGTGSITILDSASGSRNGIMIDSRGGGDVTFQGSIDVTNNALGGSSDGIEVNAYGTGKATIIYEAKADGTLGTVETKGASSQALYADGTQSDKGATIDATGNFITHGDNSAGVRLEAHSTLGSNIDATIREGSTITTAGANGHGIYAVTGTGNITVDNAAAITTGVEGDMTKGASAKGIYAVATSGSIGINNTGNITTWNNANTAWAAATGIYATTTAGGDITVTSSGTLNVGTTAIYLYGQAANPSIDQTGTLTANISGDIDVTSATDSHAVIVQARGVNGTTNTYFDNGKITGPASGIIAGSDVNAVHSTNNLYIGSNAEINTQGTIAEIFINSGPSSMSIAEGALLHSQRGIYASVITDNGAAHTNQGSLSISNAGSIIAERTDEGNGAINIGRNWMNNNYGIATILASVDVNNSGYIEGSRGIISGHAASTILSAGTITNTGTIVARNALGEAILLLNANQNVHLGTGSVIDGNIYSAATGNTLTLSGSATEDANFIGASYNTSGSNTGVNAANNFGSLTVQTDGTNNTYWTLNGSSTQLDGVDAVVINDGANDTTSTLLITPSDAGDYTFDHALSGNGTLKIALQDTADAIAFGPSVGNVFTGTIAIGTGELHLEGDNLTPLTQSTLRLDTYGKAVLEADTIIGGNLHFDGGALKTTVGDNNAPDYLLTVNGDLAVLGNGGYLDIVIPAGSLIDDFDPADLFHQYVGDLTDHLTNLTLPDAALSQIVEVNGDIDPDSVGSILTILPVDNGGSTAHTAKLMQGGDQTATVTYDYAGKVLDETGYKGIYLVYGLTQIEALTGKTVLIDYEALPVDSGHDVLGAILTGTGNFRFDTSDASMRIGNANSDYIGATTIVGGNTVKLISNNGLGQTSKLTINGPGTTLDINGHQQNVNGQIIVNDAAIMLGTGGKLLVDIETNVGGVAGAGIFVTKGSINANGAGALSGNITTNQSNAFGVYLTGSGATVNARDLTIETHGDINGYGIISQYKGSVFTGTNITVTTTGTRGLGIVAENGGTINLTNANIDVQGIPGGGSGGIIAWTGIDAVSTVTAHNLELKSSSRGITASQGSSVTLTGNNKVTTTGTNSAALFAAGGVNTVDPTKLSIITAENTVINTSGDESHGVVASVANVTLTGGSIKTTGVGSSGVMTVSATVAPTTIIGTNVAIDVKGHGIATTGTVNGASNISLTGGSLKTGGDLVNATHTAGTATVTLSNLTATAGSGKLLAATSGGTTVLNLDKMTVTGDISSDATSTVNAFLKNSTALTSKITNANVNIDATSGWTLSASSDIKALTLATGAKLSFGTPEANNTVFKSLRIRGNLTGGTNTITMSTNLAALRGDFLQIDGTTTGTYVLDLTNYGGNPTTAGQSLQIVQAANATNFSLTGQQYRDAGLYRYYFIKGETDPNNWYLANPYGEDDGKTPFSDGGNAIINSASLLGVSWHYGMDALHKRMGEVRLENNPTATTGNVWVRSYGYRLNAASPVKYGASISQDTYGLTGGIDKAFRNDGQNSTWLLGGFLDMGHTERDFRNADNGSTSDLGAGLYATWLHDSGWYADFVFRADRYKHNLESRPQHSASIDADYKSTAQGISAEIGRTFKRADGWWIEPSAQVSLGWLNGTSYTTASTNPVGQIHVSVNDADALQYRGTLRAGRQFMDSRWYPYAKIGAARAENHGGEIHVADVEVNPAYNGWRVEAGFGTAFRVDETSQVYFDYEYAKAKNYERPWSVNLGYRKLW